MMCPACGSMEHSAEDCPLPRPPIPPKPNLPMYGNVPKRREPHTHDVRRGRGHERSRPAVPGPSARERAVAADRARLLRSGFTGPRGVVHPAPTPEELTSWGFVDIVTKR